MKKKFLFTTAAWQKAQPLEADGKKGYKTRQISNKNNQKSINTTISKRMNKDIYKDTAKHRAAKETRWADVLYDRSTCL